MNIANVPRRQTVNASIAEMINRCCADMPRKRELPRLGAENDFAADDLVELLDSASSNEDEEADSRKLSNMINLC